LEKEIPVWPIFIRTCCRSTSQHPLAYISFGLSVAFLLLRLGRAALAFLRDLDDYRMNRPRR
jgi:hypothetical protein